MQNEINILDELKDAGAFSLLNINRENYFFIPDNYFANLADNILTHIFIKSLPTANPYTVPEAFFENLPEIILEKIDANITISITDQKHLFSVPDGYFNGLADSILNKIKNSTLSSVQQELEEIAPLLSKIPRTNVYSVPENYFTELNAADTTKYNLKPTAKIISFNSKARKWVNYAAAACIAAVLFAGGYLYFFNNTNLKNNTVSSLAKMNVQKEISVLSDDEIANYLKDNNNIAVYTNTSIDDDQQSSMDIQNLIQSVSDEDIQQYLSKESKVN